MPSFLSRMIAVLVTLLLGHASTALAGAAPLSIQVYRADAKGFHVASTLVMGQQDAVLIDAQFTRADAHRVVANILASGKKLTHIYISQGDPDYYFGLEVVHEAFPQAQIIASQATIEHIRSSLPEKMKVWGPLLGANGPVEPIVPTALAGTGFELEGQRLEIVGLDGPSPLYTFVWIPSIRAVVGGVRVFGNMHLWMTDSAAPAERQCWMNDLQRIEALAPRTVVPGHSSPGHPTDLSAVRFSKAYLGAYGDALPKARNPAELIAAMKKRYPKAIGDDVLALGAKVNKGEMPWVPAAACR